MMLPKPNTPTAIDDEVEAVEKIGRAEGEALQAGVDVGAHQPEQQPDDHHGQGLGDRAARHHDGGDEPEHHQREIVRRAERAARAR